MAIIYSWIRILAVFMGVSTAGAATDTVVRIGDKTLSVAEFEARARDLHKTGYKHIEVIDGKARQELLDGVIARELLVLEGLRRGYDRVPAIAREVETTRRREIVRKLYEQKAVQPSYSFSDQELRSFFEEREYATEVFAQHIVCASEEEALEVLVALKEGANFEELVPLYSVKTIQQRFGPGGWVGWFKIGEVFEDLKEPLRSMAPGSVHQQPIRTHVGWHVFRLKERRSVDFAASREWVESQALLQARADDMERYVNQLRQRYGLVLDLKVFAAMRELAAGATEWTGKDRVLLSWRDGRITARDYLARVGRSEGPHPVGVDSALLYKTMDNLAGKRIMAAEASALGLDRDAEIVAAVEKEQASLLVKHLFQVEARARVGAISEEDARTFYGENIAKFTREDGKVTDFEFIKASILTGLREKAKIGAMDALLAELRVEYADQIEIFPAALDGTFAAGEWGPPAEDAP